MQWDNRKAYRILVRKAHLKKPLGRPRRRMEKREVRCKAIDPMLGLCDHDK
jgi:hypothetical protein